MLCLLSFAVSRLSPLAHHTVWWASGEREKMQILQMHVIKHLPNTATVEPLQCKNG